MSAYHLFFSQSYFNDPLSYFHFLLLSNDISMYILYMTFYYMHKHIPWGEYNVELLSIRIYTLWILTDITKSPLKSSCTNKYSQSFSHSPIKDIFKHIISVCFFMWKLFLITLVYISLISILTSQICCLHWFLFYCSVLYWS